MEILERNAQTPNLQIEKYFEGRISIREFLVDFFGALMPGVFFLLFLVPSIAIPLYFIIQCIEYLTDNNYDNFQIFIRPADLSFIEKIPVVFDIGILFTFLAFGYIIGMLFYRTDPKKADFQSFNQVKKCLTTKEEIKNWVVRVRFISGELISTTDQLKEKGNINENDVQYPYNNLKGYLLARGWRELAQKIPWSFSEEQPHTSNSKDESPDYRSKSFINTLKIKLEFYCPEKCSTIIKNEAHIRLSSSMWFVSDLLIKVCPYALLFPLILFIPICISSPYLFYKNSYVCIFQTLFCLLTLILSIAIRYNIEKFLHYQRVREILYVLQTAVAASETIIDGDRKIFER